MIHCLNYRFELERDETLLVMLLLQIWQVVVRVT